VGCPTPAPPDSGSAAGGTRLACKKWRDNMSSHATTAAAGEPNRWEAL